jgi:hypothetical protein
MRAFVVAASLLLSCAQEAAPAQDPLDYLRVGVDPYEEADAMVGQLRRNGFQVGRRFDAPDYVAFDAAHAGDTLVRVVSRRGVVLSLQAPDVRWPDRLWVELADDPNVDFDRDGQRDVIVSLRERDRVCVGWAVVNEEGFAIEVVRPRAEWGDRPCITGVAPGGARLTLEVDVPDGTVPGARVSVPLRRDGDAWILDTSAAQRERWDQESATRAKALEAFELRGDDTNAAKLRAELEWLEHLRNGPAPMLEPADDGEEAR